MTDTSNTEPTRLVAGQTWRWSRDDLVDSYPASDGWTLKYHMISAADVFVITAHAVDDGFLVDEAPATTGTRSVGVYGFVAEVSDEKDIFSVGTGKIEVFANPRSQIKADPRSHAEKALALIEAALEGRITRDQEEFSIDGRSIKRIPASELAALRDRYQRKVDRERNGIRFGRAVRVRMP